MKRVEIYDTTLRDGEQAPGAAMRLAEKVAIAEALQALCVDTVEAGFPFASADDAKAVREIARTCRDVRVAAFARTQAEDIQTAAEALKDAARPRISLVMPVSDLHVKTKLRLDAEASMEMFAGCVRAARNLCPDVEVIAEDASRAERAFLARAARVAMESGAGTITIADTVGYATPGDIAELFAALYEDVPGLKDIRLGIHCHDDLGLATINTLTGLSAGAAQAHCTINGLGERAGNAALEEVVMAMRVRRDRFDMQCRVDATRLWETSRLVADISSFPVPPNKAIVGGNTFAHGSGMHQDGMLKASDTYEIIRPEWVGAPARHMPITRHSGRKGLAARLQEMGVALDDSQTRHLMELVKSRLGNVSVMSDSEIRDLLGLL